MTEFQIHIATSQDAEMLSKFINGAYRGDASRVGWTTEADLLDGQRTDATMLREQISAPENVILLFRDEFKLVSCVFLQRRETSAYLGMFTVAPVLQGSGIGKTVLALIEGWLIENWSSHAIELCVISKRQELVEWYMRRGYTDSGRREPFPYGEPKYGIPKFSDLELMVLQKPLGRPGVFAGANNHSVTTNGTYVELSR